MDRTINYFNVADSKACLKSSKELTVTASFSISSKIDRLETWDRDTVISEENIEILLRKFNQIFNKVSLGKLYSFNFL